MNIHSIHSKPLLALLLILCLLMGQFPTYVLAAPVQAGETIPVDAGDSTKLLSAVSDLNQAGSGTIDLKGGEYYITKPLNITSNIKITGSGTIQPIGTNWSPEGDGGADGPYGNLITVQGEETLLTIDGSITIDPNNKCRAIYVTSGASLRLFNCTIQNGNVTGTQQGAGVLVGEGSNFLADSGTLFYRNTANLNSATSGGALYVGLGATGTLKNATFRENEAHSGGAIYTYLGLVTCTAETTFEGNKASQRGGAIHSHGTVALNGTTITGQNSGQYGGAIYVSANKTNDGYDCGRVVLHDAKITENTAGSAGGGIFVADMAQVLVSGDTTVSENKAADGDGAEPFSNNVYVSTTNSKLITYGPLSSSTNRIGVSTGNPYQRKVLVYSLLESYLTGGEKPLQDVEDILGIPFNKSYSMEQRDADKFTYDSHVFHLEKAVSLHNPTNLWLKLSSSGGDESPQVIFDFNLPGKQAITYPSEETLSSIKVGDKITLPTVNSKISNGAVDYLFQGWYSDAQGGTRYTDSITVEEGTRVYYAQWITQLPPHPGGEGVPGEAGLQLVYYDQNYDGGGFTTAYTFGGQFTFTVTFEGPDGLTSEDVDVYVPFELPQDPCREGYTFTGWSEDPTATSGFDHDSGWAPSEKVTTLYATWRAKSYNLTWNSNSTDASSINPTSQDFGTTVIPPTSVPTRTGYRFTGWYLDTNTTVPLVSGTLVRGDITYYAGWVPNEYTITWDPNYTGGTTTAITQYHDEKLNILTKPIRDGYAFGGWYTEPNGGGVRAEAYGLVREDVTFYAKWVHETLDYTVTLEWDDLSDNDAARPKEIVVSLMANDIPTGLTYTLDATDATDESGNIWSYTFEGLDVTDAVSNPITYSVAITSTVSDEYSYGIENKSATLGYILMTHTLITTDINSYVVWEDDSNNDGYRPSTVNLQLYANGEKVEDAEGRLSISGSGDTWTYTFADFQKYYTDEDGNKGQEIRYTLKATPTNPGELDEYSIAYHNYTVILTHRKDTISRTVHVEWVDSNNQDGKRPGSIVAQLYADNVPLQGKFVTLSDANSWQYTWSGLPKYTAEGREVVYSAQVTSTLVDYVAKSTEMAIELTYVPSSTAISAYVTWTDDQDADGLRPDLVPVELVADGVPTGDVQVLSKVNGWTMVWRNYPMYKNGDRVEYTFRVDPVPEGYTATYNGVYDTSGLSAILRHERIRQDLTGKIVWNDRDNVAGARMSRVAILLCADGTVIDEDKKVWLSEDGDWSYVFEGLPVYLDGGKEIKYSIVTASTIGDYRATTDHMTITMDLEVERISVPLQIIWDDGNDRDGQRPGYVAVKLLIDGAASKYQLTATAETGWSVSFDGMVRYGWKEDGSGGAFVYSPQVIVPDGYTASYTSPGVVVLSRAPAYKDVTATVTWKDNDDQYGVRPDKVTLALYADYLDGNGPQHTGRVEKCLAADGWQYTFTNVPAMQGGKNIIYSVQASGDISDYSAAYDLIDVYLTHKGYNPEGYKTDYTATIVWQDGHNAHQSRRYGAALTLYANGDAYQSYTLTQSDVAGTDYTWSHTFKDLPTRLNGQSVVYTIGIGEMSNYTAQINDNTITLTNVADWIILLNWGDDGNNDGKRPDSVRLDLYADAAKTGQRLTLTGDATADSWRGVFERLPVWSESQAGQEIAYTWTVPTAEGILIEANGYTVNYNDYESATVAGERVYPLDIQQPSEVADVSVSVEWRDDTDRDGLRPETLEVRLMADYGNGPEDTGKALTLEGGNEDTAWAGIFKSLPVWRGGVKVQYSIVPQAPEGYHTSPVSPLAPVLIHDPAKEEIICTVRWEDSTSAGGLQRFPITAELVIDDTITRYIGFLDENNGYQQSWSTWYLFHEHGKPYRYTFHPSIATEEVVPADYELTVEDREIVVRRVRYHISGTVRNELGDPIPNASVTIYDRENMALSTATADENGAYTFTVGEGNYTVRATAVVGGYLSGSTQCAISNDDTTDLDIILSQADHDPTDYTYTLTGRVVDSNGESAPNALVDVWSVRRSQAASVRTDASGCFTVPGLSNGTYQLSVLYNYEGKDYTVTGIAATIFDADKEIPDIIINVPTKDPEAPKPCNAHGKVTDLEGNGLEDILVTLYQGDQLYSAVVTNDKGEYSKDGLPDGDYKAIYHYAGTAMAQQEFTVNGEADLPLEDVAIDITAKPGYGTVSGIVLDSEGKPVEGTEVLIFDKNGDQVALTETDANGAYSVTLPVGEYTITIQSPVIRENGQDVPVDDDAAEKGDSGVTANSFTLTGVVTDEEGQGVQGVTVYLYGADPDDPDGAFVRLDETVTDAEGVYTFENLPAGSYVVKIAQGIGGNGGSTDIPVEVKPNPEVPDGSGVEVTTDSYTLEGVVQDDQGQPIRGATVTLLDSEGNEVGQIITEADGIYRFENLPQGVYQLSIRYPDNEDLGGGDVSVEDGGHTVVAGFAITGTVRDNSGKALSKAAVVFVHSETKAEYVSITDSQGRYHVTLPSGEYQVQAVYGEYTASGTVTVSDKNLDKQDLTITIPSAKPDDDPGGNQGGSSGGSHGGGSHGGGSSGGGSSGGGSSGGGSVPATPKEYTLAGVVTDKDGKGVPGANVTATNTSTGKKHTVVTDKDGAYSFTLPSGSYTVTVQYGDAKTQSNISLRKDSTANNSKLPDLGHLVKAYVKGYPDGTFQGERNITRMEVAALMARISNDYQPEKDYTLDFQDVSDDAWYAKELGFCVEAGLIQGRGNGIFDPAASITRAEFAAIIARFLGQSNVPGSKHAYDDIAGSWAEGYINALTDLGIVQGKGEGRFDPDALISRNEAVTMINRALERDPDAAVLDGLVGNHTIGLKDLMNTQHWAYYQVLEAAFDHYHK